MSLVIVDRYWAARLCQAYHQTDFPFHLTVHFVSGLARSGRGWKYEFKCRHVNVARRLSAARPRTRRCAPGLGCACARPATPGARRPSGTFMNTMGTYLAAISHQAGRGRAGQGRRPALRSTEMMDELDWAELSLLPLAITRVTIINHFIILRTYKTRVDFILCQWPKWPQNRNQSCAL